MQSIIQIFFLNFITGIDNILVIGAIIQRFPYTRWVALSFAVILTINRTILILGAQNLSLFPGLKLVTGLITLLIAIHMANSSQKHQNNSLLYTFLVVVATDFIIGLDSIMATAILSENPLQIAIGVFLSQCCLLFLLPTITTVLGLIPWVQIFVAGMISQLAIQEMAKDRLLVKGPGVFETLFTDANRVHVMAVGIAIVVISFGILNQIKQRFGRF